MCARGALNVGLGGEILCYPPVYDMQCHAATLVASANAKNLLSQSSRFLLDKEEAKPIVSKMAKQVRTTWHKVVRSAGVSERDAEMIKPAFVYEGFGGDPT
jgi:serine/threonine-protein kinase HipA